MPTLAAGARDGARVGAEVLCGTDGKTLIIAAGSGEDPDNDRICTRPTAIDLDGDGKLDIVSGNFRGTFAVFAGEGKVRFAPKSTLLTADGAPLSVDYHSDGVRLGVLPEVTMGHRRTVP